MNGRLGRSNCRFEKKSKIRAQPFIARGLDMEELSDKKITIVPRSGQSSMGPSASRKVGNFFGFFVSPKAETREKLSVTGLKDPVLKNTSPRVPRADLAAVRHWVALEEKIVHEHQGRTTAPLKNAVPSPKNHVKRSQPAFETFSTQTAVSSSLGVPKLNDPFPISQEKSSGAGKFFLVVGVLAAGVVLFLYLQGVFENREASARLTQLQNQNAKLGRSYAELQNASEEQRAEMQWLNSQLHDMALELKAAKADKAASDQGLEKKYRGELMRLTVRYESELAALRRTVQTQNSIVSALKAQGKAFEKVIDQAGVSALSGAAAGLSRKPFSKDGTSVSQRQVASVNARQGFVVISMGADQGAYSGQWIAISRSGIDLAVGRIDRVYPTLSVAVVRDRGMLQVIREGDSVSLS
jgi:hypothetical protein